MDQNLRPEKAQNMADTNNADVLFHSHSSPPGQGHRSGHRGSHHRHKSHHGVPHHRDESRHSPEFQDFHGRASSSQDPQSYRHNEARNRGRAHSPTGFSLAPPQGAGPSQHPYAEDYLDDRRLSDVSQRSGSQQQSDSRYHRGSHRHGRQHHLGENLSRFSSGMSHERNKPSHRDGSYLPHGAVAYSESFHQNEAFDISGIQPDGTHHRQAHQRGGPHHRQVQQHGRPPHHGEAISQPSFVGIPDYHGEYRQGDRHPGEHHRNEHAHQSQRHHHRTHQHQDHRDHRDHHHGAHHPSHLRSDYQYRDYVQSLSQLSIPQQDALSPGASHAGAFPSHVAHPRGLARSMSPSVTAIHSHANQMSKKLHPQITSAKDSESWGKGEGQSRKRKIGQFQRTHKKGQSTSLLQWLWEKLNHLIQGFREMIRSLTQSLAFETFIFFIVCLNTIMLLAQTFAEVEIRLEWYFMVLDSIFFCIYVLEALLKIIALGLSYFYDFWNNLDFFIMAMAVLDFVLMLTHSFAIYHQSLFRIIKVFKSLRVLRAIRVLRRLSFLNSVQEVTGTLGQSLPSITAILILMFTCLFLFSVVLRALFRKSDPKRFQNIFTTIFTLFTLLTLDDWSLIYMDSRAQGAWYIIPILMVYIIIQYFIFLNLLIAVLVDNFQMALLKVPEKVKQEKATRIQKNLLEDSLTELKAAEPKEVLSEGTMLKRLIEKKFGTMTQKQQELLFLYLQLVASVEQHQQKFRSQAAIVDEIVDTTFEVGDEDFRN
ncbi:cation channel sperm-associated protein 1 [Saimiri boliviensis]|uniref:Cation channel sperm-associated protein 1 n=1 Tax=Saimiri boliviensis boliviensis TaxID=39432 RepID=A0A2K6V326_SAIBB|nr:cation channel sperm-associated protein 1 [Saimiri boliviensis boliviensis]